MARWAYYINVDGIDGQRPTAPKCIAPNLLGDVCCCGTKARTRSWKETELNLGFERVVKKISSARGTNDAAPAQTILSRARENARKSSDPFNP